MSARKYTAALFENVDYKAQAAEMAKKEKAKERQQQEQQRQQQQQSNGMPLSGFFSRLFLRSTPQSAIDCKDASQPAVEDLHYPRVLLFGDSLTQYSFGYDGGWGAMLADRLQRRADVVVRGYSGYNTRWCRIVLDQVIKRL